MVFSCGPLPGWTMDGTGRPHEFFTRDRCRPILWNPLCNRRSLANGKLLLKTRPKPAYGRQGLDWDRWARIQFSQVHFGAKLDSTDLLWCKNVTSPTGGSNRPFRCLEEGGRALPKFLAPFQNVSKKHSGYDLLLNKYSGGYRKTMKPP